MEDGFTVMNPQHSVEAAYTEWVIKAVEIIAQSRISIPYSEEHVISRQFALVVSERFGARSKILKDPLSFFENNLRVVVDILSPVNRFLVERWIVAFDSAKDIAPSIRRSERRDLTLPRRLAVALRSLLSLTRLMKPGTPGLELRTAEQVGEEVDSVPLGCSRIDLCSIPSSFGNITLKVFTKEGFLGSTVTTREHTPCVTPAKLRIDENFIASRSLGVSRTNTIEMVIEIAPQSAPVVSKSPPRELGEIWPTSSLSYPMSPGRERKPSFDQIEHSGTVCISTVPGSCEVKEIFERPVPVAVVTDIVDSIKRMRPKLFIISR
jgi:hypothetical protein